MTPNGRRRHSHPGRLTSRRRRLLALLLCALPAAHALTLSPSGIPSRLTDLQAGFQIRTGSGGVLSSPAGQRVMPAATPAPAAVPTAPAGALDGDWVLVSAGELRATGPRGGTLSVRRGLLSGTDGCDSFGAAVRLIPQGSAPQQKGQQGVVRTAAGLMLAAGPVSRTPRACLPSEDARPSLAAALERGVGYRLSFRLGQSGGHPTLTLSLQGGPDAGFDWVYMPDPATPLRSGQ